jgi:hypothetical protein
MRLIVILVCGSSRSYWWKVVGDSCEYAEEMGFEVAYGHLSCIPLMASRWHQFHVKLVCVADVIFHVLGYFVVQDYYHTIIPLSHYDVVMA